MGAREGVDWDLWRWEQEVGGLERQAKQQEKEGQSQRAGDARAGAEEAGRCRLEELEEMNLGIWNETPVRGLECQAKGFGLDPVGQQ